MPRGKPSTQTVSSSQVNDQTQGSQSQSLGRSRTRAATIPQDDLNRKVDEVVQYMLVMDQKKIPIKKLEINKTVLKDKDFIKAGPVIMEKAARKLSEVFGIEIVELQDKMKGSYILVNKLENPQLSWSEEEDAKTALLTVILSIIFMNGNTIQDGDLWHGLQNFGIDPNVNHETFGDVKKLVTQEFVRQAYLEITRVPNADQPVFEVQWGQRAKVETNKRKILKFVSKMYGVDPDQWKAQSEDIQADEERHAAGSNC